MVVHKVSVSLCVSCLCCCCCLQAVSASGVPFDMVALRMAAHFSPDAVFLTNQLVDLLRPQPLAIEQLAARSVPCPALHTHTHAHTHIHPSSQWHPSWRCCSYSAHYGRSLMLSLKEAYPRNPMTLMEVLEARPDIFDVQNVARTVGGGASFIISLYPL